MQGFRTTHLIRERKVFFKAKLTTLGQVYKEYLATQPADIAYPNIAKIYLSPIVKDVIDEAKNLDDLTELLDVLRESFLKIIEEWRQDIHQQIFKLAADGLNAENTQFDLDTVLELVTTAFLCKSCGKLLSVQDSITHPCARKSSRYSTTELSSKLAAVEEALQELPWNVTGYIIYQPGLQRLHEAWLLSGFDPKTVTVAQLKDIDPILECSSCSTILLGRATMRWQAMVGFRLLLMRFILFTRINSSFAL